MNSPPRILVVGAGDLAFQVIGQLMRMPFRKRILLTARDTKRARLMVHLQQYTTLQHDRWAPVELTKLDIDEPNAAEVIAGLKPDVIFNAMSLQSWRVITELPRPVFEELDTAQFGPWLPMHLAPALALSSAVRDAGLQGVVPVVNAAFPDAVNPCLATQGLAPTLGIGNVANIVPAMRCAVAHALGRPSPIGVEVMLYGQHFFSHNVPRFGHADPSHFLLRAIVDQQDVTADIDLARVLELVGTTFKRQGGRAGQLLTAGSAIRVLRALCDDDPHLVHAPGPAGLPGGYLVRVSASEVEVVTPKGVDLERLVALNEAGQAADGVERIDDDGTVHYTAANMDIMERMVGYRCDRMAVTDAPEAARELGARYAEFARSHAGPAA